MKRLVTITLTLIFSFVFSINALAVDSLQETTQDNLSPISEQFEEELYLTPQNDGRYSMSDEKTAQTLSATYTGKSDVYQLPDGSYVAISGNGEQVVAVNLEEFKASDSIAYIEQKYNLPEPFLNRIKNTQEEFLEKGTPDEIIGIALPPSLLKTKLRSSWAWGSEYTYQGWRLMDCRLYSDSIATGPAVYVSGYDTTTVISKVTNFLISVAGMNKKIGLFPGGLSVLNSIVDALAIKDPNSISANLEDFSAADFTAARDIKETYVLYGSTWQLGHTSRYVNVKQVEFTTKIAGRDGRKHRTAYIGEIVRTKYYDNPA